MGSPPIEPSETDAHQPLADPTAVREPDHGIPVGPYSEPTGAVEAAGEAEAVAHAPLNTQNATPGGSKELLKLALPLIVSQSFMTVQVFVDTVLLSWHDPLEMTASFPAVMWYWLFFGVLQVTAGYTSTFVAQYTGANRPHRVGPAVWQGIHFAVVAGMLFLVVVPLAPWLIALGGHSPEVQRLETIYLQCLSFAALPMLVMARGERVLLRPRADVDRPRHRGVRHRDEHRPGAGADLRPRRVPGNGDRGRGLGNGGRLVRGRAPGAGTDVPQEVPRGVQHRRRLEARTRAVRPADEVRRAGRDAGVSRRAGVQRCSRSWSAGSATRPSARRRSPSG